MDEVQRLLGQARALEDAGRAAEALDAYQAAFAASGEDPAIAGDLGRLALRLGQHQAAEQLLSIHLAAEPGSLDGRLHLAHALREQQRYAEAAAALTPAIQARSQEGALWSALGVVLAQEGRTAEALPFLDEAVRLGAGGAALYHRANALFDLGEHDRAIAGFEAALAQLPAQDQDRVRTPLALARLGQGDLGPGWDDYRARLSPDAGKPVTFAIDAPLWPFDEADGLEGRSLLLVAEQGLGDEVLFANAVPDVLRALGPRGRLTLAVEPRLVSLFARSFPAAAVLAHATRTEGGRTVRSVPEAGPVDAWAPMAAPLRLFRRTAQAFPSGPYLTADPARVAHWRAVLASYPGRKVGLLWRSLKLDGERLRQFAAFEAWAPVLRTPGITFVNLQYGDCAADLVHAREAFGAPIVQPAGVDLKDDLDEVAALTCALDLTVGFSNASFNLAGACGAPAWLVIGERAWTRLGTTHYPWYPQVCCVSGEGWADALARVAEGLAAWA